MRFFASVASYTTLRSLLAVVASKNLEYLQVDVKAVFLSGQLEETIFMKQPDGFVDHTKRCWVYRLVKALYGPKQASRAWRILINKLLVDLGFRASQQDPCLYIQELWNDKIFVLVYVDHLLMAGDSQSTLLDIASRIASKVKIRVEEDFTKFLGIVISRHGELRLIKISNPTMIDQPLSKFELSDAKTCSVPIDPPVDLHVLPRRDEGSSRLFRTSRTKKF